MAQRPGINVDALLNPKLREMMNMLPGNKRTVVRVNTYTDLDKKTGEPVFREHTPSPKASQKKSPSVKLEGSRSPSVKLEGSRQVVEKRKRSPNSASRSPEHKQPKVEVVEGGSHKVHVGPRGGRYIVVKGKKQYI